jgi:hypothetical protein
MLNQSNSITSLQSNTVVTPQGFQVIRQLIAQYPLAAQIFSELAPEINSNGEVLISLEDLAKRLGKSKLAYSQISEAQSYLDKQNIVTLLIRTDSLILHIFNPEYVFLSVTTTRF